MYAFADVEENVSLRLRLTIYALFNSPSSDDKVRIGGKVIFFNKIEKNYGSDLKLLLLGFFFSSFSYNLFFSSFSFVLLFSLVFFFSSAIRISLSGNLEVGKKK